MGWLHRLGPDCPQWPCWDLPQRSTVVECITCSGDEHIYDKARNDVAEALA